MEQREAIMNSGSRPAPEKDESMTIYEADLRRRLAAFPNDAQAWFQLGKYLKNHQRYEEAEIAIRKALSLNPSPAPFRDELKDILKILDVGGKLEQQKKIEQHMAAVDAICPCVSCGEYTYYGCAKGYTCDSLVQWRRARDR